MLFVLDFHFLVGFGVGAALGATTLYAFVRKQLASAKKDLGPAVSAAESAVSNAVSSAVSSVTKAL